MCILERERGREQMESLLDGKDKESLMEHRLVGIACGIFFFLDRGGRNLLCLSWMRQAGKQAPKLFFPTKEKKKKAYKVTANLSCISAAKK